MSMLEVQSLGLRALGNEHAEVVAHRCHAEVPLSRATLPASILDRSRMSLMIASRCSAAPAILPNLSAWSASRLPRRCRTCVRPMMAFIGVRISWLMLARNALLARLAASARVARLRPAAPCAPPPAPPGDGDGGPVPRPCASSR